MPEQITVQDLIRREAKTAGVPEALALAVAEQESGFNPTAINPEAVNGEQAVGTFQFLPSVAKSRGIDPHDPVANIKGGVGYLRELLDRHQGDLEKTLAEYGGVKSDTRYVPGVLARLSRFQNSPAATPGASPARGRLVGQPPPAIAPVASHEPAAPGRAPLPTLAEGAASPDAPPSPTGFERELTGTEKVMHFGGEMGRFFDPRTATGRRNLAGGTGAALATIATGGTGGLALGTAAVLGAAGGGMVEEAGEQAAGTYGEFVGQPPVSSLGVLEAGAQQGGYELGGQLMVWPFKALGRRLITSTVGQQAQAALVAARRATLDRLSNALDAARAASGDVKTLASETVKFTRRRVAESMRGAKATAKAGVKTAEQQATTGVEAAAAPFAQVAQPPQTALAGRVASEVIEGPATEARNAVGKQVEAVAREGPDVDIRALKAEAQTILDKLAKPAKTFPRGTPEEAAAGTVSVGGREWDTAALEQLAATGDAAARVILQTAQASRAALESAQGEATQETLKHPAMGVISRILNADDTVPFYDAHLWKSELQNALQGTYDKVMKKQVTNITQKLTGSLRQALASHEPYNAATAAYQAIVPLYTKEYAAALRKAALTDPESLVRMIKVGKPTAARMLRDLLVTQSAEGGQAVRGQQAWDLVRSAWTQSKLLKGGIDQLAGNLEKLPKEFSDVFYGDASGQAVLQNLRTIASSYKAAQQAGTLGVEAAKQAGEASIEQTRRLGAAAIGQAERQALSVRRQAALDIREARTLLREGRIPTAEEAAFAESSLVKRGLTPEQIGADIIRTIGLGPFQIWGGLSLLRLMRGPRSNELLQWAAYSDANTQLLAKLFTGASPTALTLADAGRIVHGLLLARQRKSQSPADAIAPAPSHAQVGTPPPG